MLKLVVVNRQPEVIRRRPNRPKSPDRARAAVDAIVARFAALTEGAREQALRELEARLRARAAKRFAGAAVGNVHYLPFPPRRSTSREIHEVRRAETRRGRPPRAP